VQENGIKASIWNSINNREPTNLYWCPSALIILSYYCSGTSPFTGKTETNFFAVMENGSVDFSRRAHSCNVKPRTSAWLLEKFKSHTISFHSSLVITRQIVLSWIRCQYNGPFQAIPSPWSHNPDTGSSTLHESSFKADGTVGIC
jgi:hypothetical protein